MAGVKITDLPAAPSAQLTDVFPVDQLPGPVTYKESNAQLLSLFQSNMVASITGTANQVIASSPTGAVTLSLPQSIATSSSPQFNAVKTGSILDSNGTTMLKFTTASSAVNYFEMTNSGTAGGPALFSKGSDTNVNITFITQGTGTFVIDSANTTTPITVNSGTALQHITNFNFANTANNRTVTFQDASGTVAFSGDIPAGVVTSVSGTTNRITSTGGTTPVIDISASYVGQSSITTLGTIGTGTWQGSVIGSTYGGTGINNGASTITLGGSLVTSGAFASTFTMTGVTGVTFPTSGTLATTAGTVSSVSGTSNRITSTGGTTPVIDISGSYVGQSSITTLGTITSGTWTGTTIAVANGGTGITSFGTGVATALGTNVNGSGAISLTTSPTLVTPVLGAATATSISFGGGTLNTYAENTSWTPVLTFVTPGDVSVSYSTQTGKYSRIGNIVVAEFVLVCTPTYTTASGNLNISGLPFTIGSAAYGSVHFQSSTFPAGTTSLFLRGSAGGSVILIGASGSAVAVAFMSTTQLLTGVAVNIQGTLTYLV